MPSSAAARRYARAIFGLARDEGRVDEVRGEMAQLAKLFEENPELRAVAFQPLHPVAERRAVLDKLMARLGLSPTVRQLCAILVEHGRMANFYMIREELERLADEAAGHVEAQVSAASPLPAAQLERLRRALTARTEREVQLRVNVDPTLLGGVIAKVGDLVFDGSLRTQLVQLRANLMKGR
jgi:F-type H+-transporting ATPase subunit delta